MKSVSGVISGIKIKTDEEEAEWPSKPKVEATKDEPLQPRLHADDPESRIEEMRGKALSSGSVRMRKTAPAANELFLEDLEVKDDFAATLDELGDDAIKPEAKPRASAVAPSPKASSNTGVIYMIGVSISLVWIAFAHAYAISPASDLVITPSSLAIYVAGVCAPLALIWGVLIAYTRRADMELYASNMHTDLEGMLFTPTEQQDHISDNIAQLRAQRSDFSEFSQQANETLTASRELFRDDLNDFANIAIQAEERIESLTKTLGERLTKLESLTASIEERTSSIDKVANDGLAAWEDATTVMLKRCTEMEKAIAHGVDAVQDVSDSAEQQSAKIKENWQETAETFEGTLERTAVRLEDLGLKFVAHNDTFKSSISEIEKNTKDMEDKLSANVELSEHAALTAENTVRKAIESLASQKSEIAALGTDISAQTDALSEDIDESINTLGRKAAKTINEATEMTRDLEEKFDERTQGFSAVLQKIMDNTQALDVRAAQMADISMQLSETTTDTTQTLENTSEVLRGEIKAIGEMSSETIHALSKSSEAARRQRHFLAAESDKAAMQTKALVEQIEGQATPFLHRLADSVANMHEAGTAFGDQAKNIEHNVNVAMAQTQQYREDIKSEASFIHSVAQKAIKTVEGSVQSFSKQLGDLDKNTDTITKRIEESREAMDKEARRLGKTSEAAIEQARTAAGLFARQSEDIAAASEKALKAKQTLEETDATMQRDHVISSSKFLIESLHSLSVDLSRMVNGHIAEKTWKAYQRGDTQAFTRELTRSNAEDIKKARKKYKDDNNFRTCANRFMRQFEDVYAQATKNDHGALLSATFASSDVGRLYALLCVVADKPSKAETLSDTII